MSLAHRYIVASSWVVSAQAGLRVVGVLATALLARLLSPADYGLYALTAVVRELLQVFFQVGTAEYLMRQKTVDWRLYDTAWTLGIIRGTLLGLAILAASGPIASFLEDQRLREILWVTAGVAFINGFMNNSMAVYRREMNYRPSTVLNVIVTAGSLIATVVLAFVLRNYWALAGGAVVGAVLTVAVSYWLHPHRPKLGIYGLKDMFGFGVWISLSNVAFTAATRMDAFILQKLVSPAAVGFFATARDFTAIPVQETVRRTSGVFASALVLVEEKAQRRRIYFELIAVYITTLWPVLVGLALVADDASWLIFGSKWEGIEDVITPVALLLAAGLLSANVGTVVTMAGAARLMAWRSAIYIFFRLPAFYFGARWNGLEGAVLGYCFSGIVLTLIDLTLLRSIVTTRARDYLRVSARPGLAVAVMVVAVLAVRSWLPAGDAEASVRIARLSAEIAAGAAAYPLALWALWVAAGRPAEGPERRLLQLVSTLYDAVRARANRLARRGGEP